MNTVLDYAFEITHKRVGRKEGKTIARKTGGTKFVESVGSPASQVLSDENICELGLLIQRVFDALGCGEQHHDIEWVFDGKDFALVQARPLTALPRYTFDELKNQPDIWSNVNLKDAQPMVQSTLNWSLLNYLVLGVDMPGYQGPPGLKGYRLYQGQAYWNLSIIQWLNYDTFGITPRQVNEFAGGFQPEIEINEKKPFRGIKGLKKTGALTEGNFYRIEKQKKRTEIFCQN